MCNFEKQKNTPMDWNVFKKNQHNLQHNDILYSTLQKECAKKYPTGVQVAANCPYFVSAKGKYPGFTDIPCELATINFNGKFSYKKLFVLLRRVFLTTDRVLVKTSLQNFVVFRQNGYFYLYNGCTCHLNRFRHMDLSCGVAGLIFTPKLDDVVSCIKYFYKENMEGKPRDKTREEIIQEILATYS